MDESLLQKICLQDGLNWNKWGEFLSKWADALLTYGTPINFLEGTSYPRAKVNFGGVDYDVVSKAGGNSEMRRELMKKQKPYVPLFDITSYDARLDFEKCFLCQNVVQGIDAEAAPELNNVVADHGKYFIMPNRYPTFAGHSLWVPINHDDMTGRIIPSPDGALVHIPGLTRGAILRSPEIDALMAAAEKHNLGAVRNHVLDAMSIPSHDHFHMIPVDHPFFSFTDYLSSFRFYDFGKGIFKVHDTPLDTLVITTDVPEKFSERVSYILGNMERDGQVFTLAYNKGRMFISPRKNIADNKRIQIGAAAHIHFFDFLTQEFNDKLEKYVPKKGEYDWAKYVD